VVHTVRGVGFRISNEILDAAELSAVHGVPTSVRTEQPVETDA
jgi:hypothetical protein